MTESKRRVAKISEVKIEGLQYDSEQRFYILIADVYDELDILVEKEQRLLKSTVGSENEIDELQERITNHLGNIHSIQSRNGGRLDKVRLLNMSIEDAEEFGYLEKIGYIKHVPIT